MRVESAGEEFVYGCEIGIVLISDVLFELCSLRAINNWHLIEFGQIRFLSSRFPMSQLSPVSAAWNRN